MGPVWACGWHTQWHAISNTEVVFLWQQVSVANSFFIGNGNPWMLSHLIACFQANISWRPLNFLSGGVSCRSLPQHVYRRHKLDNIGVLALVLTFLEQGLLLPGIWQDGLLIKFWGLYFLCLPSPCKSVKIRGIVRTEICVQSSPLHNLIFLIFSKENYVNFNEHRISQI